MSKKINKDKSAESMGQGKVVRNDVLEMCTKILELYDSHCSFSWLKSNLLIGKFGSMGG